MKQRTTAAGLPQPSVSARVRKTVSRLIARSSEAVLPEDTITRLRTGREWRRWVDSLTHETLADLTEAAPEVKRRIFKAHVRRVEIETHAKCNRICSFCPNILVDRRLNQTLMDDGILENVFDELGSINYSNQITVARYSEPLANRDYLYGRLARARTAVPHAELGIVTNTDYLTPSVLEKLHGVGLNTLYMSLYLRDNESWSTQLARAYTERLAKKLDVRVLNKIESATNLMVTFEYKGMSLRSTCRNWEQYGTDRGGSLAQYQGDARVGPCREPFETFVIDYNGSVMPCCALRSDLPEHRSLVAGDLSALGASIFDIYAGRLGSWRRSLSRFGQKEFPCATCQHRDLPAKLVPEISKRLDRRLQKIGLAVYRPPTDLKVASAIAGANKTVVAPEGLYSIGPLSGGGTGQRSPSNRDDGA